MPRYIAFLRAVNVGKRQVKMDALKRHFEELGFADVATIIASGNVVFSTNARNLKTLERRIEQQLEATLGFEVETLVRSAAELAAVARDDPFTDHALPAGAVVYALFLRSAPSREVQAKIRALNTTNDQARVGAREVYWRRLEQGKPSEEFGVRLAKLLEPPTTSRNMNTVRRIVEKYCQLA